MFPGTMLVAWLGIEEDMPFVILSKVNLTLPLLIRPKPFQTPSPTVPSFPLFLPPALPQFSP